MALLAGLPGVLTVTSLTLQADAAAPVCGNVDICASDLVRSGQHRSPPPSREPRSSAGAANVSASEQPISRVNYFNGQRLEAADFRAEQDYQIAVRRKLYSALYSVGIVQGLEVTKHPTDQHKVIVARASHSTSSAGRSSCWSRQR